MVRLHEPNPLTELTGDSGKIDPTRQILDIFDGEGNLIGRVFIKIHPNDEARTDAYIKIESIYYFTGSSRSEFDDVEAVKAYARHLGIRSVRDISNRPHRIEP